MKEFGPLVLLLVPFFLGLALATVGITVWGIVDAATRPEQAWQAAGQNKTLWIVLQAAGLIAMAPVGLVLALVYLLAIRPKVRDSQRTVGP
jgi:hypothetical protein